jgi:hypothetical protein
MHVTRFIVASHKLVEDVVKSPVVYIVLKMLFAKLACPQGSEKFKISPEWEG